MDGVAYLISESYTQNDIGVQVPTSSKTSIFVREKSITRTEWRDAGHFGLNPSTVLVTPSVNYSGQRVVEYKGERYSVYRTFQTDSDDIELYLEKKAGV